MIIKKVILFFLSAMILFGDSAFSQQQSDAQEYTLKAAFVYRFTDYVEGNINGEETFNIAVLGINSGILAPLYEIANDKRIKSKKINVKQYDNINDLTGPCQILFVSKNYDATPLESVVFKLEDKPLLIITEQNGGCTKGAHINFLTSENKLKFEVNLRTTSRSGLKISSQLLQHALTIVR